MLIQQEDSKSGERYCEYDAYSGARILVYSAGCEGAEG